MAKQPQPEGRKRPRKSTRKTPKRAPAKRTKRTTPNDNAWKETFLEELRETGIITTAAQIVGMRRATIYAHRDRDPEFAAAMDEALEEATDLLEEEARRRAYEGVEEPIYQGGKKAGTRKRYSDRLLLALLAARRPQAYGKRHNHVHEGGVSLVHDAAKRIGSDPKLRERARELALSLLKPDDASRSS